MTRCDSRAPIAISARFAAALLTGLCVVSSMPGSLQAQPTADSQQLTYRLNETWIEGGGGSITLLVHQAGDVAVARHESDGSVAMVSNPAAGIVSAGTADRLTGFGGLSFLIEMVDVPESFGPGSEMPMGDDWVQVIESISFNLERGDSDRILQGHQAEHRVLTIDLRLQQVGPDGWSNSEVATGRADLWTAPDLPFSWLPYTSPNAYVWALPLSFNYRQVGAHVLAELSDELLGLGLLLRSEIQGSIVIGDSGSEMEYIREVSVEGLETAAGPLDMTPLDRPVLTMSSSEALFGAMMLAGMSCTQEMPPGASSLTLKTDQPREIAAEGEAWVSPDPEMEGTTVLIVGSLGEGEGSCVVVITEPAGLEPGEYALAAGVTSDVWETIPGPKGTAYYFRGTEESNQLTLIDSGTLVIESAGPGKLRAELRGKGWTGDLTPSSPALIEDVSFELSFTFEAAERTPAAPADPEDAVPGTATPVIDPPPAVGEAISLEAFTARQTFAFERVGPVAMDPAGRWAAVGTGKQIAVLDLETGTEAGILAPEAVDGIGALAFAPDGKSVAAAIAPGVVVVVGVPAGELLHRIDIVKGNSRIGISELAISPSGQVLVVTTQSELDFFDLRSGDHLMTLTAAEERYFSILRVAWSRDGALLASTGNDKVLRIWPTANLLDLTLDSAQCVIEPPEPGADVAFTSTGDAVVLVDYSGNVHSWSPDTCEPLASFSTEAGFLWQVALSPDGQQVITGGDDGTIRAFTAADGSLASTLQASPKSSGVHLDAAGWRMLSVSAQGEPPEVTLWERR